jgi:hypothetical protein
MLYRLTRSSEFRSHSMLVLEGDEQDEEAENARAARTRSRSAVIAQR